MIINDNEYGQFDVRLGDDGTLDTVIKIYPWNQYIANKVGSKEIRFSTEYGADFRDDDGTMTDEGFEKLAKEAVEAYIEQYLLD